MFQSSHDVFPNESGHAGAKFASTVDLNGVHTPNVNANVTITPGDQGTPFFADSGEIDTNPGNEVDLFTFTVPGSTTRRVSNVMVTCNMTGKFRLYVDGQVKASGRTSPSQLNAPFPFSPSRPLMAASEVRLTFEANADQPSTKVEGYLMATDQA